MAKSVVAKTTKPAREITCPVTGQKLSYSGRGRPPVFAKTVTPKQRRDYYAGVAE